MMNPSQTKSERHRQKRLEWRRRQAAAAATPSTIHIPNELIKEVFSFLPAKSLIRFKCVSKSYNSFISDPTFIQKHFYQSSRNVMLLHTKMDSWNWSRRKFAKALVFTGMINKPSINVTLTKNLYYQLNDRHKECRYVIGSCNGLLCLFFASSNNRNQWWLRAWNPATRILSDKFGYYPGEYIGCEYNFTFGYDNLSETYKVVLFLQHTTNVRVLNLKDNVWRDIQDSPVVHYHRPKKMKFVHFSNSVNWLVVCNYFRLRYHYEEISIEQFVIISLDLHSETHTKLLPPQGFNEVPFHMPNLSVLNGCLCFSHDFERTHFIIWQMKEFGIEESWTQFLKISYHNLRMYRRPRPYFSLFPLCLLKKNDTIVLTSKRLRPAILYNWRDNTVRRINKPSWFRYDGRLDYVESMFSYC